MQTDLIKKSYDQVWSSYAKNRRSLGGGKYLKQFMSLLSKRALVLDLGCGDGEPVAATLLKQGFLLTGLDISAKQIASARKNFPAGEFLVKDLAELKMKEYQASGVVSLYTFFHLPRETHLHLLKVIASFLPKGGPLLLSMGDRDFEGFHDFYGAKIWSSHYGPVKNSQLVTAAGFKILLDTIDNSGREKHQIFLAKKL